MECIRVLNKYQYLAKSRHQHSCWQVCLLAEDQDITVYEGNIVRSLNCLVILTSNHVGVWTCQLMECMLVHNRYYYVITSPHTSMVAAHMVAFKTKVFVGTCEMKMKSLTMKSLKHSVVGRGSYYAEWLSELQAKLPWYKIHARHLQWFLPRACSGPHQDSVVAGHMQQFLRPCGGRRIRALCGSTQTIGSP
jgi:hypothetical protein